MSARVGLRKLSPSSATGCTRSATIVASDSASCRWRSSGRPLTSLPPKSRPTQTAALDSTSAAVPAARLVIQKRGSVTAAASMALLGLAGRDGGRRARGGVVRGARRARGVGRGGVVGGGRARVVVARGRAGVGRGRVVQGGARIVGGAGGGRGGRGRLRPARSRRRRAHRAVVGDRAERQRERRERHRDDALAQPRDAGGAGAQLGLGEVFGRGGVLGYGGHRRRGTPERPQRSLGAS